MLFWAALPAALFLAAVTSIAAQHVFTHFVDLARLERHLGLTFAMWLSLGWFLEAQGAERIFAAYSVCATRVETRMNILWEDVISRVTP